MQKEKSVRTYQRKSKNGKVVTVRSYKAKYDAAEEARKEMAKRAGAGEEFKKKKSSAPADLGFTADEFKIWANDLDEKEAKRIDKILVKKYGEKAVQKLADEINAGNSRTHKAVFARLSSEGVKKTADKTTSKDTISNTTTKVIKGVKGVKGDEKVDIVYKFSEDSQGRIYRMRQVNGGTWKKCPLLIGEKSIRDFDKATRDLAESQGITFRNGEWVKRVGPALSGKDVSKQLTEKKATKTKSSDVMSKSAKETSSKKQVLHGEAKNMGASAIKYNNKTYMVTTDGKVETVTGRKVGKALSDKILGIKASGAMSKRRPTDAPKSQRDSYERHVSSQISGGHQTLSQIMETLASSGKWSNDEKMRRAAQRIYDKQK